jgi:SSS family solute:Na+ symporter
LTAGLEPLDFAAILGYLALTFGIALWFSYRQKTTEDFFVGGRSMPWFAVGLSILATLFSTLSYQAVPAEAIKNGFGLSLGVLAAPFSMFVILVLWIPFFMRLRLTSAYEYLELRFNYSVRLVGALLFVLLRLGWMSMVIFAASYVLDQVKGPDLDALPGKDLYWWIGLIGMIAAVYTALGGIEAMIWVDVLQCLLLLLGIFMTIGGVMAIDGTGPADWWRISASTVSEGRDNIPPFFSWDVTVRTTVFATMVNYFFWNICTHGSDQVVLQRYFSTPSLKSARRSFLVNFGVDLSMSVLLSFCGLALLSYYLNHPSQSPGGAPPLQVANELFGNFMGTQLPAGFAGLIISAFLCDAIQTLESGANAITAVAAQDIVPRLRRGGERILSELTFARLLSFVITLLVTANAYFVADQLDANRQTIVDLMPKFFNMFVGPLASLFMIGMFLPRCTARSTIPAVLCGFAVSLCWSWWPQVGDFALNCLRWIGQTPSQQWIAFFSNRPTPFFAIAAPCLTALLSAALLSIFVERGGFHHGLDYTWKSVVRRRAPAESNV